MEAVGIGGADVALCEVDDGEGVEVIGGQEDFVRVARPADGTRRRDECDRRPMTDSIRPTTSASELGSSAMP